MTHRSARSVRSIRSFVVIIALALASTVTFATTVSADVLTPLVDVGAPGGGGGFAGQLDESARGQDLHALTAGGTVAANYDDVLAGSGYEQADTAVAHHPTQNELSVQRIESAQTATGALAGGEDVPQARGPVSAI